MIHNITPKTRDSCVTAWKAFVRSQATAPPRPPETPVLTRADLQHFVVHLRERGGKPVSCNCWLRGLNAFGRWLHAEGKIAEPVRVRPQKEVREGEGKAGVTSELMFPWRSPRRLRIAG